MEVLHLWKDFFVATAGASAALAGLVIVAMSVNLKHILEFKNLPPRASSTIGLLGLILVISIAGLIPDQSLMALGIEIIIFGIIAWLLQLQYLVALYKAKPKRSTGNKFIQIVLSQLGVLPVLIGGSLLTMNDPAGLYWVAAGVIISFVLGLTGAWVLLIEILR